MPSLEIRDMQSEDEYFVSTCSHVNESDEIDACGRRRLVWLREMYDKDLRIKVALIDNQHSGFLYMIPIEQSPWGPVGKDLVVIPCLWVLPAMKSSGTGRALVNVAVAEAQDSGYKGAAVMAYYHDFWFMPADFFETLGFVKVEQTGSAAILWKVFHPSASPPVFLKPRYKFDPVPGKVVIDLFWNVFCMTSDVEAERIREVAAEFGDKVQLNEYQAEDHDILCKYQIPRAILINGKEIGWGYEAPRDDIRKAIEEALKSL